MRWCTLLVIVALIVLAFVLWRKNVKEHFFGGTSLSITWTPPAGYPTPQNLVYNWNVCTTAGCDPSNPSSWPNAPQTTPAGTLVPLILTNANCPGCDFNESILFAVQSFDTVSKLTSGWVVTTFNLNSQMTAVTTLTDQNGNTLAPGSTGFSQNITLSAPIGDPQNATHMVTAAVTRGSTVYTYVVPNALIMNSPSTFSYSSTFTTQPNMLWTLSPGAPGPLQTGDVVTLTDLIVDGNSNGQVYYYGQTTTTVTAVIPGAPSNVGYLFVSNF